MFPGLCNDSRGRPQLQKAPQRARFGQHPRTVNEASWKGCGTGSWQNDCARSIAVSRYQMYLKQHNTRALPGTWNNRAARRQVKRCYRGPGKRVADGESAQKPPVETTRLSLCGRQFALPADFCLRCRLKSCTRIHQTVPDSRPP